jgi:hypothetical protein
VNCGAYRHFITFVDLYALQWELLDGTGRAFHHVREQLLGAEALLAL